MTTLHLTAATASQAWDDLAQRLEQFIATWEENGAPTLGEFLPAEPLSHRRFVLSELIKVDLEQRTARGQIKRLEEYGQEFPELLENGEPPCDLIYEEYHVRKGAGLEVSLADYCQRFPKSAAALKRLMGTENISVSTQLFSPTKRIEGIGPGQKLDDFDLLVELGKGAFASVYLARQVSMNRLVALKVSANRGNEPQTLSGLDHPNIIRVYDQRQLPEKRMLLLYMQFAPGGTLAEVVRLARACPLAERSGKLLIQAVSEALTKSGQMVDENASWRGRMAEATWPETVCRLGVQLAQALDHAHRQGTLHRDVKPANVLLSAEGSPKLADFNISFSSQIEGATPAAYFGGSLAYMSPEQLEACNPSHDRSPDELDGRADLYSLAVLLWELLHGERPFRDDEVDPSWSKTLDQMAQRRRNEQPAAPPGARDPVTRRLEQVLRKALSPNAADRNPDGASLARELALCLNPRAWDLVNDLGSGWRNWARRHPVLSLFPINLPPFVLASLFNLFYNKDVLIKHQVKEIQDAFWLLCTPINSVLIPLGTIAVLWYAWPAARALRCLARGSPCDAQDLRLARARSLSLGYWIAGIGMLLWMAAGVAFPMGIWIITKGMTSWHLVLHFLLSMFTCGLISCCFPFLSTTWLALTVFFPALLASTPPDPTELKRLLRLSRWSGRFLALAVVVPLLGMLLALLSDSDERIYSVILVAASVIGFGAAWLTFNQIRADLAALTIATRPSATFGTVTDSIEAM